MLNSNEMLISDHLAIEFECFLSIDNISTIDPIVYDSTMFDINFDSYRDDNDFQTLKEKKKRNKNRRESNFYTLENDKQNTLTKTKVEIELNSELNSIQIENEADKNQYQKDSKINTKSNINVSNNDLIDLSPELEYFNNASQNQKDKDTLSYFDDLNGAEITHNQQISNNNDLVENPIETDILDY